MPELKTVSSSEVAASSSSCTAVASQVTSQVTTDSADATDPLKADAANLDSTTMDDHASSNPVAAAAPVVDVTDVRASGSTFACAQTADKTTFNVILKAKGASPYQVVKEVRAITGLGLKEAQALVDSLPNVIKEAASWDEAKDVENQLKAAGGDVEVE
jgi:large subunit ribosomal protein L7/L12